MPVYKELTDEDVDLAVFFRDLVTHEQRPPIVPILDDSEDHYISVMQCRNAPRPGVSTLTTLSLHDHPNLVNGHDIRTELVLTFNGDDQRLNLVIGSAGLNVAKDSWPLYPGIVYPYIIRDMAPGYACEHLLFTAPGTFPELSRYQYDQNTTVHWLQAVPLHESERQYLNQHGLDALEDLLEKTDAQIGDLDRPPVA